ncbi:FadR/GntR family transcriptional regulator [Nocardioides ganghwensis]|uniref:FadR family transcriptional regulator n=1 Tax=Nocardioides ganghwensis TaxID=252230 RepID=A0A4Q2SFY4_9ACTN|nr:GntR family transcriptional regulator [Nocardioides ganghwensis]MBD3946807.1 FadR family transcriptional regulator [Nocardioides ganghwensis]RYC02724.1 FadR family transcriptional regulator [Nocardioides ganghwensis]
MTESRLAEETFFRPVRPGNAFEDTVQRLLQTIRLGVVAPGESLPSERDLAVRLGVSRDTVREALRSLGEAGYVVARRGRYGGTFVADELPHPEPHDSPGPDSAGPDDTDLEEVLALREVLEVGAARLAASRTLSAPERDLVWRALDEVTGADPADYRRLDSRLHLVVAEITGVRSLVTLVADNRMRVNRFLDGIPLLERNIAHSDEQHRTLVTAILAGQPDAAAAAAEEHLAGSAALLRGFLA